MATSPATALDADDTDDPTGVGNTARAAEPGLTYEAARAQLQEVLRALESGGQPLEESLALWRRGEELADVCQRWLDGASAHLSEAIAARENEAPAQAEDRSQDRAANRAVGKST